MKTADSKKENLNWKYIQYLTLGIMNWVSIIYIYKYAIEGNIKLWVLLIITFVLVYFGFVNLGMAKDYYRNKELSK